MERENERSDTVGKEEERVGMCMSVFVWKKVCVCMSVSMWKKCVFMYICVCVCLYLCGKSVCVCVCAMVATSF